jgi:hypothetical protein
VGCEVRFAEKEGVKLTNDYSGDNNTIIIPVHTHTCAKI